jgi:cellobiose-specific phosphotransferase system component IIC
MAALGNEYTLPSATTVSETKGILTKLMYGLPVCSNPFLKIPMIYLFIYLFILQFL